jgi:hypothetical protein
MQVNQASSVQGSSGMGLEPVVNDGAGATMGVAGQHRAAVAAVRTHDVRHARAAEPESVQGRATAQVIRLPQAGGGWLGRVWQALQGRVQKTQEQSLQRQAALLPEGQAPVGGGGFGWLRMLSTASARLRATAAQLKEPVAPQAAPAPALAVPASVVAPAATSASAPAAALDDNAALSQATAAVHQRFAAQAADKEAFTELLRQAFGDKFDAGKAEAIRQQTLAGNFSWAPSIQVVDSQTLADTSGVQGAGSAQGAYAADSDTIYLSRELLHSDPAQAQRILMEEMGHAIDARINTSDAVGDEGEIFSKLMHGEKISAPELAALRADNDSGVVNINGRSVAVEYGWFSKIVKAVTGGIKKIVNAVVNGAVNLVKSAVNVVVGLATFDFDRVKQGLQQGISAVTTTIKEVTDAVKETAKELHKIAKEQFKKLMQSKIFAAVLMICRFIPIPIVQLVVRIIDLVRAAYMVYQGIKNKSLSAVIGGVASLVGGAGNVAGSLGASASTVSAIKSVADAASKLSMAYNAVANKDIGAAVGLLGGMAGGPNASPEMAQLATVGGYVQQAVTIGQAVKSKDALGALGGVLGAAGSASGSDSAVGQQLANAQEVVTGLRAVREIDRGNLDAAQSLAMGMGSVQAAGKQADEIQAQQRAAAAQPQAQEETQAAQGADEAQEAEGADEADEAEEAEGAGEGEEAEEAQQAEPAAEEPAASKDTVVTVGKGQTLEGIARANYGENWRAGLAQMALDNGLKLNQWGSPILRQGQSLVLNDISGKSEQELASLSRTGGRIIANNDKGLQAKADLEERARAAAAQKAQEAAIAASKAAEQSQASNSANSAPTSNAPSYVDGLSLSEKWKYAEALNAKTPGEKAGVFLSNSFASGALETLKASSAFLNHPIDTTGTALKNTADFAGDLFGSAFGEKNSQIAMARRMESWWGKTDAQLKAGDYANMGAGIPLLPPVVGGRALLGEMGVEGAPAAGKITVSAAVPEVAPKFLTTITPEMESKILFGERVLNDSGAPTNRLIGAHAGEISNAHPNYAVDVLSVNADGTRNAKLLTQFPDGNLSKIKTSTLFPEGWTSTQSIHAIKQTGDSVPVATRVDGATLHQSTVNGVKIEVIKVGNDVTAAYPCGKGCTSPSTFAAQKP